VHWRVVVSAFDAVSDGEQREGEQDWTDDAGGDDGPGSGCGEWLVCGSEDDRVEGDLEGGSGALRGLSSATGVVVALRRMSISP
jgi:hypothetical protein